MRELVTEQQAQQIVLALSQLIFLGSLGFGFFWKSRILKARRLVFLAEIAFVSLWGPLVAGLWFIYNAIEDHYGLDSVKALGINAFIFIVVGALWGYLFFFFIPAYFRKTRKA
ncbi:MAG: hypothetical protein ACREL1_07700 [bacterium]